MSSGREILAAAQQMRTLMVEVSRLLLEADAIMGSGGWGPRVGSTAQSGGSTSINYPKNWFPYRLFRFYSHEKAATLVACISVVLDEQEPAQKVTEPLVTALVMGFESPDDQPEGNALYQVATWHLYVPSRKDDGTWSQVVPRELWPTESKAKTMSSLAVPLVSIQDRVSLERTVVSPLLQLVSNLHSEAKLDLQS